MIQNVEPNTQLSLDAVPSLVLSSGAVDGNRVVTEGVPRPARLTVVPVAGVVASGGVPGGSDEVGGGVMDCCGGGVGGGVTGCCGGRVGGGVMDCCGGGVGGGVPGCCGGLVESGCGGGCGGGVDSGGVGGGVGGGVNGGGVGGGVGGRVGPGPHHAMQLARPGRASSYRPPWLTQPVQAKQFLWLSQYVEELHWL